jgi:hypothetical protein
MTGLDPRRRRGFVAAESEARGRGGLTATPGTDDDAGLTSLAGVGPGRPDIYMSKALRR